VELGTKYQIQEIAFDPYNATQIVTQLTNDGFLMVQFRQGFLSMNTPTKELLRLVMAGDLNHLGNPALRWMADNVVATEDPAGNLKPDKSKSTERIDGIVALIMALGRAQANPTEEFDSSTAIEVW
jgi:phage terminase large subunit-like protein